MRMNSSTRTLTSEEANDVRNTCLECALVHDVLVREGRRWRSAACGRLDVFERAVNQHCNLARRRRLDDVRALRHLRAVVGRFEVA